MGQRSFSIRRSTITMFALSPTEPIIKLVHPNKKNTQTTCKGAMHHHSPQPLPPHFNYSQTYMAWSLAVGTLADQS